MFMMSQVSWFNHRFECHLHPHKRYFSSFCGDHNAVGCSQCRFRSDAVKKLNTTQHADKKKKKKLPSCENTEVKLNYRVTIAPHLVERLMHGGGENLRWSDQWPGQNQDQKLWPYYNFGGKMLVVCYWCQQGAKKLVPDLVTTMLTTMLFNVSTSKMLNTNFLLLFLRFS